MTNSKNYDIASAIQEITEYFKDAGHPLSHDLNLQELADENNLTLYQTHVALCNLEDSDVMEQIAEGNYMIFDINDRDQFNDSYIDMMIDLGLMQDDEESEEECDDEEGEREFMKHESMNRELSEDEKIIYNL